MVFNGSMRHWSRSIYDVPIIYDIAIKEGIRPERPMAVSSIASQMGVCASPASVAVVSVVAM